MHFVNITRYVIRIKKHLHNRIEIIEIEGLAIIEIELNRKEYESLHPVLVTVHARILPQGEMQPLPSRRICHIREDSSKFECDNENHLLT